MARLKLEVLNPRKKYLVVSKGVCLNLKPDQMHSELNYNTPVAIFDGRVLSTKARVQPDTSIFLFDENNDRTPVRKTTFAAGKKKANVIMIHGDILKRTSQGCVLLNGEVV